MKLKFVVKRDIFQIAGSFPTFIFHKMRLKCGGIINDYFITHLLRSLMVKVFWKSVNIWRSYGQKSSVLFVCSTFLRHPVFMHTPF